MRPQAALDKKSFQMLQFKITGVSSDFIRDVKLFFWVRMTSLSRRGSGGSGRNGQGKAFTFSHLSKSIYGQLELLFPCTPNAGVPLLTSPHVDDLF